MNNSTPIPGELWEAAKNDNILFYDNRDWAHPNFVPMNTVLLITEVKQNSVHFLFNEKLCWTHIMEFHTGGFKRYEQKNLKSVNRGDINER